MEKVHLVANLFMQKGIFESRTSVSKETESMVGTIEGKHIELMICQNLDPMSTEGENDHLEFAKALINI